MLAVVIFVLALAVLAVVVVEFAVVVRVEFVVVVGVEVEGVAVLVPKWEEGLMVSSVPCFQAPFSATGAE